MNIKKNILSGTLFLSLMLGTAFMSKAQIVGTSEANAIRNAGYKTVYGPSNRSIDELRLRSSNNYFGVFFDNREYKGALNDKTVSWQVGDYDRTFSGPRVTSLFKVYRNGDVEVKEQLKSKSINTFGLTSPTIQSTVIYSGGGGYLRLTGGERSRGIKDNESLYLRPSGNIGIGLANPEEKLHVAGNGKFSGNLNATNGTFKGDITANRVRLNVGTFPDYVFAKGYDLMPLEQVEAYIKANQHLPKVPAATKVIKEGMDVGQINVLLMEKVEELTLHTIEQHKQIKLLMQEVKALKTLVNSKK